MPSFISIQQRSSNVFLSITWLSAVVLGQAITEPVVVDFLGEHCLECHDAETAKADFILDPLHFDFAKPSTVDAWQKVLEKLETGEMPPARVDLVVLAQTITLCRRFFGLRQLSILHLS